MVNSFNGRNPCVHKIYRVYGRSTKRRRKVGMTSSQYGLYELGYTRITMVVTKNGNSVSWSKFLKSNRSSDWSLQVGTMK